MVENAREAERPATMFSELADKCEAAMLIHAARSVSSETWAQAGKAREAEIAAAYATVVMCLRARDGGEGL